jgi:hypothetical protein
MITSAKPAQTRADAGALLLAITQKHFPNIETLETRNSDGLDFHDVAVWAIRDALAAAYEAGLTAAKR